MKISAPKSMMSICFIFWSSGIITRFATSSPMTGAMKVGKNQRNAKSAIMGIVSKVVPLGLAVSWRRGHSQMSLRTKITTIIKRKMAGTKSIWKNNGHFRGRFASNNPSPYNLRPSQRISSNRYHDCHENRTSVHQGQNRASYDFQRCWCPRLSAVDTDGLEDPKANDHHYIEQAISGQFESQRWGIFFIWFLAAAIIIGSCTLQWRSEAERDSSLIGKSGSEVGMNRMME